MKNLQQLSVDRLPRAPRYETLDVLRGLACLAVVLHHAPGRDRQFEHLDFITRHFWIGVQIFFVISGYCIAATCDAARRHDRSFRWYMTRRVRRILPPYWAALLLTLGVCYFGLRGAMGEIDDPAGLTPIGWIGNMTLTELWLPALFGGSDFFILRVAWTLWYEEQFYLVCGLMLVFARRYFFAGTVALTLVTLPLSILNWSGLLHLSGWFFDGYWLQFSAGMLVYHARNYAGPASQNRYVGLLISAAILAVVLRLALPKFIVHYLSRAAFLDGSACAFALSALLLWFERWDATIAGSPLVQPFQHLGAMCYSLYLTHPAIIDCVRNVSKAWGISNSTTLQPTEAMLTLISCLVGAAIFHRVVEVRFLNPPAANSPAAKPVPIQPFAV